LLLFAILPAPLAMLFIIPIICMGLYYIFYVKLNKSESNKLDRIENQIIKITNIILIYLVVMAIFRNDGVLMIWTGLIGANIMLILLYICVIAAYLILRDERIKVNENKIVDVSLNNHKRGLHYLIAATILARFSVTAYLSSSSTAVIRIVIIFILLCLSQYELNKNLKMFSSQENKYPGNILKKPNNMRNVVLAVILIIVVGFTDGKIFMTKQEKQRERIRIENQQFMKNFLGE
jgi:hypothetical protein